MDRILETPERAVLLYPSREGMYFVKMSSTLSLHVLTSAVDLSQLVSDHDHRQSIDTLVVLDGTWRQASSIFNTNARLQVLQLVNT